MRKKAKKAKKGTLSISAKTPLTSSDTNAIETNGAIIWLSVLTGTAVQYAYFNLNPVIALSSATTSVIALSAHLSNYIQEPKYNLCPKLKNYAYQHKVFSTSMALGILTTHPWKALGAASMGFGIDQALTYRLSQKSATPHAKKWGENGKNLLATIKNNPGTSLAIATGFGAGLYGYSILKPVIYPASYTLINNVELGITALHHGADYLDIHTPPLLLSGSKFASTFAVHAIPPIAITSGSTWLAKQSWEKLRDVSAPYRQTLHPKKWSENGKTLLTKIKNNPGTSLAIAAGIGGGLYSYHIVAPKIISFGAQLYHHSYMVTPILPMASFCHNSYSTYLKEMVPTLLPSTLLSGGAFASKLAKYAAPPILFSSAGGWLGKKSWEKMLQASKAIYHSETAKKLSSLLEKPRALLAPVRSRLHLPLFLSRREVAQAIPAVNVNLNPVLNIPVANIGPPANIEPAVTAHYPNTRSRIRLGHKN